MNTLTPRTDKAVQESNGQWSFAMRNLCIQMECEIAALTKELTSVKAYRKVCGITLRATEDDLTACHAQRKLLVDALSMYGLPYTDEDLEHVAQNPSPHSEIGVHEAKRELIRRQALAAVKGGSDE